MCCEVVDFPVKGQQTKNYEECDAMVAQIPTDNLKYIGLALIGQKKNINKIVRKIELMA